MYKANIDGIQTKLAETLRVCDGWAKDTSLINEAKSIVEDYTTAYFDGLEYEGTIVEFDPTVEFVERGTKSGLLVEVDCLFPEACETDRLTFRHVVLANQGIR